MTEVIMPKMGDGMEEGTLLKWLKEDGDKVSSGEIIGEIQTDKATLELESPGKGVLTGFLIKEGETVPVGVPIAAILKDGENLPDNWGSGGNGAAKTEPQQEEEKEAPAEEKKTEEKSEAKPEQKQEEPKVEEKSSDSGRIKASPLARRVAREEGVDLSSVEGSGPGGRIVEKDVRDAIGKQSSTPASAPAPHLQPSGEDKKVSLNPLRKITAERTQQSKQQAPHFYVTVEVDIESITEIREMFKLEEGGKISINDFVIRATALALRDMPEVNASFGGDHVLQHGGVHIGMAVAVEDGLTVPVIRNADQLTLRQINAASKDLAGRARDNKLKLDEMQGSTFSISNMGMLDVENFAAIINGPNAGIIAVASSRRIPVVNESDELEIRTRMNMTGSFDHRVVDGAVGAKFMNVVRDYLQNPTRLLS